MEIVKYYSWVLLCIIVSCISVEDDEYASKDIALAFGKELQTYYAYPARIFETGIDSLLAAQPYASISEQELAYKLGSYLSLLHDGHVHLYTSWGIMGNENYFSDFTPHTIDNSMVYLETYEILNPCLRWGKIRKTPIAYLYIRSFEGNSADFEILDSILTSQIFNYSALIIDVRGNRGGLVENSFLAASFFSTSDRCMGYFRRCLDGKQGVYTSWISMNIRPATLRMHLPLIIILTDRFTYSAAEWFVMAMANQSHVTIMGDTTGGGISAPLIRELPNGWLLSVSNTQYLSVDGIDYQFLGFPPDVPVVLDPSDTLSNRDYPLEYAIDWLLPRMK